MKKKTICLLSALILSASAVVAGLATTANVNSTKADLSPRTVTINKDTIKNYYGVYDYVETENGNHVVLSSTYRTSEGDAIYSLDKAGSGISITTKFQAITSVSITFQFGTNQLMSVGGGLTLDVGDSSPAYRAAHDENFNFSNDLDTVQTKKADMADPSQCNYVDFWFTAPVSADVDNTLVFEIAITYLCA